MVGGKEMKKTGPWVSGSKYQYFVHISTKENYDFLCPFFNFLQSHKKLTEK